jgi:uncharacterized membrane protein YesL
MKQFSTLISLLRDRKQFFDEIRRDYKTEKKIGALLVASSIFLAVYGAIIGASSSWLQMISSAIKLPALYLITLTICLPTLYFFDILFGSALSFGQYALLALISVAVISVLLFSFAPISLFFLISVHDYNFFLLLNVGIFAFTGLMGVKFLYQAMQAIDRPEPMQIDLPQLPAETSQDFLPVNPAESLEKPLQTSAISNQKTRRRLLQFWLVLYGLVGSQLGWTLRPFFGSPGEPFQLFRNIEGNFYSQVFRSLFTLLGWN